MNQLKLSDIKKKLESNKYSLLYFFGEVCGACIAAEPIYNKIVIKFKDKINFLKINISHSEQEISDFFDISAIPSFLLFEKTKLVNNHVGYLDSIQLTELITNSFVELKKNNEK